MGLIDSIIGVESGGNPNSKNPNSSASGLGNFIDSTWLSTLKQTRPDLADGKSDADLLALKTNPDLSRQMTEAYANQNQAILSKAGVPVTDGNTYLAHFAGPGGAVSVLNADPSTPIASILPSAMKANPFLQGMTAGDLRAWADRKMGGSQAAPTSPAAPPSAPPGQPLNLAPQAAPIFAQQPQAAPQQMAQAAPQAFELPPQMQPIFASPRKQIDLSKLRAAFTAPNFYRG